VRPFKDDLDEFEVFENARARRLYEKQRRKVERLGSGLSNGPRHKRRDDDYKNYDVYEDNEDYEVYDEGEFDSCARIHHPY